MDIGVSTNIYLGDILAGTLYSLCYVQRLTLSFLVPRVSRRELGELDFSLGAVETYKGKASFCDGALGVKVE